MVKNSKKEIKKLLENCDVTVAMSDNDTYGNVIGEDVVTLASETVRKPPVFFSRPKSLDKKELLDATCPHRLTTPNQQELDAAAFSSIAYQRSADVLKNSIFGKVCKNISMQNLHVLNVLKEKEEEYKKKGKKMKLIANNVSFKMCIEDDAVNFVHDEKVLLKIIGSRTECIVFHNTVTLLKEVAALLTLKQYISSLQDLQRRNITYGFVKNQKLSLDPPTDPDAIPLKAIICAYDALDRLNELNIDTIQASHFSHFILSSNFTHQCAATNKQTNHKRSNL